MKIGFAGRWSPMDKTAWSGIYFHTYKTIKQKSDVEIFKFTWPWHIREELIFHKQIQKIYHRKVAVEFLQRYAKWFSKELDKALCRIKADVLFVPGAPQLIAYCKTSVPIIYMADATFQQLQGYYDSFSNLAPYNIRQGIELDKRAFNNAAHCMLASDWAKQSAVNDYHIPQNKITIQPFGANLDFIPSVSELKKDKNGICQLLFLGVEWDRKGGQIALDTFYSLHKKGVKVQLTIIGCRPPLTICNSDITVIPFLDKNIKEEAEMLYRILLKTSFLLLPTRAECAGIAFCEACAFGIPSITTNTGGVSEYIQNGLNGFALPMPADAEAYADKIMELYADADAYLKLCVNSRNVFDKNLNWDVWGKSFYQIAESVLKT